MSFELTTKNLEATGLLNQEWYYSIELLPGIFSHGQLFDNVALTRQILKNIPVRGMNCLDIGCMEGLVSVLLKKQGARSVLAYDRFDYKRKKDKIDLVRLAYNVDFDTLLGKEIFEIPFHQENENKLPYDVIVFSGVLYHMFDPLAGLARIRGMLRNGGILILETAAVINNSMAMYFNAKGQFQNPRSNFFYVSLDCLDYLLRFLRLFPLDCLHLSSSGKTKSGMPLCRVVIPCRACSAPLPEADDEWMYDRQQPSFVEHHFQDFLDWRHVQSEKPDIPYEAKNEKLIYREDIRSVNIYETVRTSPEMPVSSDMVRLRLSDIY